MRTSTNLVSERLKGKNPGKTIEITLLGNSRITITHTPNMSWRKGGRGREEGEGRGEGEEGEGGGEGEEGEGGGGEEGGRGEGTRGREEKEGDGRRVSIVDSTE